MKLLIAQAFSKLTIKSYFDSLAVGIHKIKCKYGHGNKKCQTCRIKYLDCECCLE